MHGFCALARAAERPWQLFRLSMLNETLARSDIHFGEALFHFRPQL